MTLRTGSRKAWILSLVLVILAHVGSLDTRLLQDDSSPAANHNTINLMRNRERGWWFSKWWPCKFGCGMPNPVLRIVGGQPTTPHKYPWLARLHYEGSFHCGATLINKDYVLTAAHCVYSLLPSQIHVVLGDYDQYEDGEDGEVWRAVSKVISHPNYDNYTMNNDIALLKLRKSVKFSQNVRPVCSPRKDTDPAGKNGITIGWGRTSEDGDPSDAVLEIQTPIYSLLECRMSNHNPRYITENMFCAGRKDLGPCPGDSGGPLFVPNDKRMEIIGIVSWNIGCGREGFPAVYTRVTRYLNWIKANIEEGCLYEK